MSTIKTLRFGVIAMSLALFAACGGAKDPAGVAKAFLNAMADGDYETAKKHATAGSHEAIDQAAQMAESMEGLGGDDETEKPEIKIGESTVGGDKATVAYTEDGVDKSLDLVKEEGDWKVEFSKMPDMGEMDETLDDIEGWTDSLNEGLEELEETIEGEGE